MENFMMKQTFGRLARVIFVGMLPLMATLALSQPVDVPATHVFAPSQPIPNRYIVVFKSSVGNADNEAANIMRGLQGKLHHTYKSALKGFSATLPAKALPGILKNPNVDYIEQDQTVALNQTAQLPETITQNSATWGIDRIDQVSRPLSQTYTYNYIGTGVTAFIIDTGINSDHTEFTGRIGAGSNFAPNADGRTVVANTGDCNGHGTHVAGTVGGTYYGVAKGVTLVPVRVLDCAGSGSNSGVIAGINWAAATTTRPAVANMSLGGGLSSALNAAVAGAVNKGVTMVVAAGNSNRNACNYSPASEPSAITVGASTSSDARASYSNYGTCLDIFAPGSSITSAWIGSNDASNTISGTSMASPHVAGVVALALAAKPDATPSEVVAFLKENGSSNKLSSIGTGSPNLLVYSLANGAPTAPVLTYVAVKSITPSASKTRKSWTAKATVTVYDLGIKLISGATVSGTFNPGGSKSCVTDTSGSCTLTSSGISNTIPSSVFTVTNVVGVNMTYVSESNQATDLKINRP